MHKRLISLVSLLFLVFSFISCSPKETKVSENVGEKIEVLGFGLIPTESTVQITERWQPLFDHIERVLGVKVIPYNASDYAGIIEAMRFKKIEVAYFGPKSYMEAHERANAQAIAMEVKMDGSSGYYGVIITKKESGLNTLNDLKGKTFAFNDPNSTSGYLVPMTYFLTEANIVPEKYFSKVLFSGSHEASIMAVKTGTVNAASTNDLDLDRAIKAGRVSRDDFNIIWKSGLIPNSPIAVRGDLPPDFITKLKEAITSFSDPKGLENLQLKGFAETEDKNYDSIREMEKIKEDLLKKKQ